MIKFLDYPVSCDAISYVVAKTILEDIVCLSFDEDFSQLGLTVIS